MPALAQAPEIVVVDKPALAAAMRKWFHDTATDDEISWLLQAGYLKLPIRRGQGMSATAKGWEAAKAPFHVS